MKLPSLESSQLWRPTHHPVRDTPTLIDILFPDSDSLTVRIGLQTPRLKRLAEIVSAQAMAQQEKLEIENGVQEE